MPRKRKRPSYGVKRKYQRRRSYVLNCLSGADNSEIDDSVNETADLKCAFIDENDPYDSQGETSADDDSFKVTSIRDTGVTLGRLSSSPYTHANDEESVCITNEVFCATHDDQGKYTCRLPSNWDHSYTWLPWLPSADSSAEIGSSCSNEINSGFCETSILNDSHDLGDGAAENEVLTKFESLKQNVLLQRDKLPAAYFINLESKDIEFISVNKHEEKTAVKTRVCIYSDFSARVFVHNKELSSNHFLWDRQPQYFHNFTDILGLLNSLSHLYVCIGNPDDEYVSLVPVGAGLSDNKQPGILAYREGDFCATQRDLIYSSTIRSVNCDLLHDSIRCSACSKYRKNLRARKERLRELEKKDIDFTKSTYKHVDLPRAMLVKKIEQQKEQIKSLESKILKMERQLRKEIVKKGISVAPHENNINAETHTKKK